MQNIPRSFAFSCELRGTARHIIATAASLLATLAIGCSDDEEMKEMSCPAIAYNILSVRLVNGAEGASPDGAGGMGGADGALTACPAEVFWKKGTIREEMACFVDGPDCTCRGGNQGAGTYEVTVEQDGHVVASQSATTVTTGSGCNWRSTANLEFTL